MLTCDIGTASPVYHSITILQAQSKLGEGERDGIINTNS